MFAQRFSITTARITVSAFNIKVSRGAAQMSAAEKNLHGALKCRIPLRQRGMLKIISMSSTNIAEKFFGKQKSSRLEEVGCFSYGKV